MAVKVQFQIGHSSKLRSKKTVEGFTHDWELYVKGINQSDISAFVEKIIFNLHESFQKPKRVCNKPPFVIQESGYAGFLVFIDIYFKNRDEPKKVQFNYDLDLQTTGPPQHRHEIKTFIFDNPSEEFRQKLLKNGGVPVSGVVGGAQPAINNNIVAMPTAIGINHSMTDGHKIVPSEGKKHKVRPDDTRSNSFANLFGPPITKTSTAVPAVSSKHSPESKTAFAAGHATHQTAVGTAPPVAKEKLSKDKEKPTEKSKERSEKREKHHKPSFTSPHKEGRSESKKTDGSKHEKREKTEEKPKKDKSRDKDRERDRDKSSSANINNNSNSSKRPSSPKAIREQSPHKTLVSGGAAPTNVSANNASSLPRPSSSSSGKIEDIKLSAKPSSKESTGENKSKETRQKESSSSSSSGKKSKKDKKDREKERDKEKRHEEREKQKIVENQQRTNAKEDPSKISSNVSSHSNITVTQESKTSKAAITPLNINSTNDVNKKSEKVTKQDIVRASSDKNAASPANLVPPAIAPTTNNSSHSSAEKKSSSSSSVSSNQNQTEKDKRSHKHRKKEKSKDKDRERDKERDKEKDREKEKDKEKEKEFKKEKDARGDKHLDEKTSDANSKHSLPPANNNSAEEHASTISPSSTSSTINSTATSLATTPTIPSSSSSSSKSSKSKDKKSKEKSSAKEEKLKHKLNDPDAGESKAKQAKLGNSNSTSTSSSLSASSSSSSVAVAITVQNPTPNQPNSATAITNSSNAEASLNLDLSDPDSFPASSKQQVAPLPNNDCTKKPSQKQPSPINPHSSDSSNSSFPDLQLNKPVTPAPATKPPAARERSKSIAAPIAATPAFANPTPKEPPKPLKSNAKEKTADKPAKEEEKEKKRRRNSQAVNTFIEPPLKQLKAKEPTKSVREKSKSPSLRNTGSRASISGEGAATFLQPSASPSSTAAAAPLPPPSSAALAAHSPALSATEAVGNATSATANAATCNNSSSSAATSAATNSTNMAAAAQHLPLEYLSELQELHHKIMTLQDNEDLQHVVELIAATGCYEITTKTFDFDLCKLDRGTVQRLQDFFATSVS